MIRRFVGGLLLAAGLLIAVTSGGCTAFVLLTVFGKDITGDAIGMLMLFGGLPTALGAFMALVGYRLLRRSRP